MAQEEIKNRVVKINQQNIPLRDVYSICSFIKEIANYSLGTNNRYNINLEFVEILEK